MHPILIVAAVSIGFALIFWGVRGAMRSASRVRAQNPLGFILIAVGVGLLLFRAVAAAVPLLTLGAILLLRQNVGAAGASKVQTSKVRSAHLEMTLDHDTGTIDGQVLTGVRQGQVLSNLALHDLLMFHDELEMDEESIKLLETFLDGAHPEWRVQEKESSNHGEETSPPSARLSRDEAYQLLGLEAGCSEEDIRKAYHRIIKRVHPDSGGSAALTAQITEARDRLLGDRE